MIFFFNRGVLWLIKFWEQNFPFHIMIYMYKEYVRYQRIFPTQTTFFQVLVKLLHRCPQIYAMDLQFVDGGGMLK